MTEARLGYVRTVEQGPPPPPSCGPSAAAVELTLRGKRAAVSFGRAVTADRPRAAPRRRAGDRRRGADPGGRRRARRDRRASPRAPTAASRRRCRPGTSRTLRAAFRAAPTDPALACSATARVAVRAKGEAAGQAAAGAGRVVRFRGRVNGPLPATGKLLDLQAFDGGRWRKFGTTRTRRGGTVPDPLPLHAPARAARLPLPRPRSRARPASRTLTGYTNVAKVRVRAPSGMSQIAPSGGSVQLRRVVLVHPRRRPRPRRRRSCPGPSRRSTRSRC